MFRELINNYNSLPSQKKKTLKIIVPLFAVLLFAGIMGVYAFYAGKITFPILANQVGNFDGPRGDLAIVLYRQTDDIGSASPKYGRTYSVPQLGYSFSNVECSIPCTSNQSDACHYTYDIDQNIFTVTSNKKVNCSFYFNKTSESDIDIHIMLQDDNGGSTYQGVNYREVETIPAYGFEYNTYSCVNEATVNYNSQLKTFSVSTGSRNTCYAYFNATGDADIIVNAYVQSEKGSEVYTKVDSIPTGKVYALSQNTNYKSACVDSGGVETGDIVTYSGGYITVTASKKQTCNVYLDLYEGAPIINDIRSTAQTTSSITIETDVTPGNAEITCYQYQVDKVSDKTSCTTTPTYTATGLNSCTYYRFIVYVTDANGAMVGHTKTFKTAC